MAPSPRSVRGSSTQESYTGGPRTTTEEGFAEKVHFLQFLLQGTGGARPKDPQSLETTVHAACPKGAPAIGAKEPASDFDLQTLAVVGGIRVCRPAMEAMLIDLLVYSEDSEGTPVEPEAMMASAQEAGLDGLVVSGRSGPTENFEAFVSAGDEVGIRVFPGHVVETDHGLVLALLPEGAQFQPEGEATALLEHVASVGGASVALRPYDREVARPMGDQLFTLQGLNACEVCNGRVPEIANDLALEAASNLELPCVSTSSAQDPEDVGTAATIFRRPVDTMDALVEQIREGACWPVSIGQEVPRDLSADRSGGRRRPRADNDGERRPRKPSGGDRGGRRRRRNGEGGDSRRVTEAPEHADNLPDDIGNRLQPGEASPFHDATSRE